MNLPRSYGSFAAALAVNPTAITNANAGSTKA